MVLTNEFCYVFKHPRYWKVTQMKVVHGPIGETCFILVQMFNVKNHVKKLTTVRFELHVN